jgi:nitrous oxidase accessory protein NosD
MGFTTYLSSNIEYRDCSGFSNRQRGLNCENSEAVRYLNCRAGGRTTGNRGDGIYLYRSLDVQVIDCRSEGNQSGLVNNGSTVRVVRGRYTENAKAGMAFSADADWANSSLEESPAISGNGRSPIVVSGRLLTASSASQ